MNSELRIAPRIVHQLATALQTAWLLLLVSNKTQMNSVTMINRYGRQIYWHHEYCLFAHKYIVACNRCTCRRAGKNDDNKCKQVDYAIVTSINYSLM